MCIIFVCLINMYVFRILISESREGIKGNTVLGLCDPPRQFSEEDKKNIDVPFFDLETILAATDSFSDANKLGQGGFGPVYKVILILSISPNII